MSCSFDFINFIAKELNFLVSDYGYSLDLKEQQIVYCKSYLAVSFSLEEPSSLLVIEINDAKNKETFSLYEVLKILDTEVAKNSIIYAKNLETFGNGIKNIKGILLKYCGFMFETTPAIYPELLPSLKKSQIIHTMEYQYGSIKEKANEAWERKKYKKALKLYKKAKPSLSQNELTRLKWLEKSEFRRV